MFTDLSFGQSFLPRRRAALEIICRSCMPSATWASCGWSLNVQPAGRQAESVLQRVAGTVRDGGKILRPRVSEENRTGSSSSGKVTTRKSTCSAKNSDRISPVVRFWPASSPSRNEHHTIGEPLE